MCEMHHNTEFDVVSYLVSRWRLPYLVRERRFFPPCSDKDTQWLHVILFRVFSIIFYANSLIITREKVCKSNFFLTVTPHRLYEFIMWMGIGTKPPKMYLYSIQKSHRTWRPQMKSWSALQEQTLIMCEFTNTVEITFLSICLALNPQTSVISTAAATQTS